MITAPLKTRSDRDLDEDWRYSDSKSSRSRLISASKFSYLNINHLQPHQGLGEIDTQMRTGEIQTLEPAFSGKMPLPNFYLVETLFWLR